MKVLVISVAALLAITVPLFADTSQSFAAPECIEDPLLHFYYNGCPLPARIITFDVPQDFDGWSSGLGCVYLATPYIDNDGHEITWTLLKEGIGRVTVLYGDQTPQWFEACMYKDRIYFSGWGEYVISDAASGSTRLDSFTGLEAGYGYSNVDPITENPFEYMGSLWPYSKAPITYSFRTDEGNHDLDNWLHGALSMTPHYLPLDGRLDLRVEGIYQEIIELELNTKKFRRNVGYIDPAYFEFDSTRYDGVLVNGINIPVTKYDSDMIRIRINMTEMGWPLLNNDEIVDRAKAWYKELYSEQFLEKYGKIPDLNHDRYLWFRLPDAGGLVTYRDAALNVEVPLIIHNVESYTGSHPDIGWCREPLVLVVRSSGLEAACVMSDSVQELLSRGWARTISDIPEDELYGFEHRLIGLGFKYESGTSEPKDAFRAAILNKAHVDDVSTRETFPGLSFRDIDYLQHFEGADKPAYDNVYLVGTERPALGEEYFDQLIRPEGCKKYWNSPEPIDERVVEYQC